MNGQKVKNLRKQSNSRSEYQQLKGRPQRKFPSFMWQNVVSSKGTIIKAWSEVPKPFTPENYNERQSRKYQDRSVFNPKTNATW